MEKQENLKNKFSSVHKLYEQLNEENLDPLISKQIKSIYLKQKYDPNTLKKEFY